MGYQAASQLLRERLPKGTRLTKQREEVFDVLVHDKNHPTATDVFVAVKDKLPGISLATVYNCLETLTACGAVNQVNLDRSPTRYCANLAEHVHFYCESCEAVFDAPPQKRLQPQELWHLPEGSRIEKLDIALRGRCPECC